jgi:fluoroquinolone transport system permease protein
MRGRLLRALLKADLRKLGRDPVLLASALVPILLAALLRLGLPVAEVALAGLEPPFDLGPHRATIAGGALAVSTMMAGWVVGFMLLEERAQRMLPAIGVTPLTRRGFVLWRLALPTLIALLGAVVVLVFGRYGAPELGRGLAAAALLACSAPCFALALVAFADNEVEGLALAKFGGLAFMLPLLGFYIEGPWAWAAGVLPPFWALRLYAGGPWWLLAPGVAVTGLWALWLLGRFRRRVE